MKIDILLAHKFEELEKKITYTAKTKLTHIFTDENQLEKIKKVPVSYLGIIKTSNSRMRKK